MASEPRVSGARGQGGKRTPGREQAGSRQRAGTRHRRGLPPPCRGWSREPRPPLRAPAGRELNLGGGAPGRGWGHPPASARCHPQAAHHKGASGAFPCATPALCQAFQAPQSLALAWVPAAVAPWPTGTGRTCSACRWGSEIAGYPASLARCLQVIAPPPDPPGRAGRLSSHPHQLKGSFSRTYCV